MKNAAMFVSKDDFNPFTEKVKARIGVGVIGKLHTLGSGRRGTCCLMGLAKVLRWW